MESLVLRNVGGVTVELLPEAVGRRDELIRAAQRILSVRSAETMDLAVANVRNMKAMAKEVEFGRETAKAPILQLGRKVDGVAKELVEPLRAEVLRVEGLITIWQREQKRIADEAERVRLEEIRKAQEAMAKAEAEVRARDEAVRAAQAERARAQAEKDFAATRAARQAEVEARQKATIERLKAEQAEAARIQAQTAIPVVAAKQQGVAVRKEPRFEIINWKMVFASRPDFLNVTPRAAEILRAIRDGLTESPGIRIWWDEVSTVR